jgi:hypothetical protein
LIEIKRRSVVGQRNQVAVLREHIGRIASLPPRAAASVGRWRGAQRESERGQNYPV